LPLLNYRYSMTFTLFPLTTVVLLYVDVCMPTFMRGNDAENKCRMTRDGERCVQF
jgi:hypothetical protein